MVNRLNKTNDGERDRLTPQDAFDAINYISESPDYNRSQSIENLRFDDLIISLANAHENRRARQVTEWESMRRHNSQVCS
jgi:hypothetical protein